MRLYNRDYRFLTSLEKLEYEKVLSKENLGCKAGKINHYDKYPEAVKHNLSLFPNNHISLHDMKQSYDLHDINLQFQNLVHAENTNERDILRFINHEPQAYHIIGSIFIAGGFRSGHHIAYLFPEFKLGDDYRADYLLIGKGSGGYEYIFVELEKSNGRISLKDGSFGQAIRSGNSQIKSWKRWIDANFHTLRPFFDSEKRTNSVLPEEFYKFDNTRMHYVVVAGTREDYNENTYHLRRSEKLNSNILTLHYDNLFDAAEELLSRNSF